MPPYHSNNARGLDERSHNALKPRVPRVYIFIGRILRYAWAFPNTLVGLLFIVPALLSGGGVHVVQGVIEIHGGMAAGFLRYFTLLRGGASAMTLGHVVLGKTPWLLDATRAHERVHVRQVERWGPLFVPAYVLCSLLIYLRGGRPYLDNPFEREAYALGAEQVSPPPNR